MTPPAKPDPEPTALAGAPASRGLRVLVVDDNQDATDTMAMLLGLWGYDVRTARDGNDALAVSAEHRPDVALLDIGLPGMSGYELAEKMRLLAGLEETVLVAMTGYGEAQDKEKSRQAGLTIHLVKPVHPDALQKLLATMVPRRSPAASGGAS